MNSHSSPSKVVKLKLKLKLEPLVRLPCCRQAPH